MRILFKIRIKTIPMILKTLCIFFMLSSSLAYAQTSPNSDSANYFLQKGLQEKKDGRRMEAFKHFDKAYKFDANNKEIVAEMAASCLDLRKYAQARENYKKLVELGDVSAATYKHLMTLSYNLKQNDDVVLYANKLKSADPSEKINYFIGKVQYEQENYGEAIKHLNAAAKEEPANAEVPYMIARSYADMLNYKLSIPYFQKAIELDATKSNWVYELGLIYYAMHEDKNALKYIIEAGDKGYKKDNDYLENLGIAHLNVGNLDQGVAIMSEILKKRPSDMNILNMVAEAYYYKGKFQLAIDYWDQILFYDKTNAAALYMIGMSYQKKGDKEKGTRLCDKAIEMDPTLAANKQKKMGLGM